MARAPVSTSEAGYPDAAHGAEHSAVFPPLDASTFAHQIIWFAITFGGLYFVLSRYALPAVEAVLERRSAALRGDLDEAARQTADAEAARASMERASAEARAQARARLDEARAAAQAEITAATARADEELGAQAAAATARLDGQRREALANVEAIAADLARDIAARLAPARS